MQKKSTKDTPHDSHNDSCECPLCALMGILGQVRRSHSPFFNHLANAEIELLKAFKSLIDHRLTSLEGGNDPEAQSKKATRIEVE